MNRDPTRPTALLFAQEGAKVVIGDINEQGAAETAQLITRNEGGNALAVKADVTKRNDVQTMIEAGFHDQRRVEVAMTPLTHL